MHSDQRRGWPCGEGEKEHAMGAHAYMNVPSAICPTESGERVSGAQRVEVLHHVIDYFCRVALVV